MRRVPVSLRMFVAMLAIFGAGVALWVGVPVYQQQRVMEDFDRLHVDYETRPIETEWLHGYLRKWTINFDRLPQDVVSVRIGYDVDPGDFNVGWFRSLPNLEKLKLEAAWFGRIDLTFLRRLTSLRLLSLRWMQVSDDELTMIGSMANLGVLDLTGTQVTDSGLGHLASLKKLTWIGLGCTNVTDAGINELQGRLPNLSISTTERDTRKYETDNRDWWSKWDD